MGASDITDATPQVQASDKHNGEVIRVQNEDELRLAQMGQLITFVAAAWV